ncbi:E3 ubiquitin/ISG15 ligase TRIM25-like [Anomaloglossus baeobatrachus]
MASASLRKELECSICLILFKDPVTLRCGHSFCRDCIDSVLDRPDQSGIYSCPGCQEQFKRRPTLMKNITLYNIVENFRSTYTHREEITGIRCTYCIHSPVSAVRSCLHCEASLCDNHLSVHSKGPEHVLTDPSTSLENRKCSVHHKILEYFCTEDSTCICVSCHLIGLHKGHRLCSLDKAANERKKKLKNVLQQLIPRSNKTEGRVQTLEENREKTLEKAAEGTSRVTTLFIHIGRRVEDLEKRVLSEISRLEDYEIQSLCDMIQKLKINQVELSMKMRHIEELCNMTDPLTVLQDPNTAYLFDLEQRGDEARKRFGHRDRGAELISSVLHTLSDIIRGVNVTFFVQDPTDILLDVNTADNNLLISDDLKTATWTNVKQKRPDTAVRFRYSNQVMSSGRFRSGRHYWDVDVKASMQWSVGMCYPSIDRRGIESEVGENDQSWCLYGGRLCNNQYSVIHVREVTMLPHRISSDGVRIHLDYEAGQLSFYELCDSIRHLYTFYTTFTEPLHAVIGVLSGSLTLLGGSSHVQLSEDSADRM